MCSYSPSHLNNLARQKINLKDTFIFFRPSVARNPAVDDLSSYETDQSVVNDIDDATMNQDGTDTKASPWFFSKYI